MGSTGPTDRQIAMQRVEEAAISLKPWERKLLKERIEEHMGSIQYFPAWVATMLLSTHLRYSDRFQLTLFMLGNGCAPIAYAEWLIKRGMLKDKAAREHVAGLISDHKSGKLEIAGRTCYVMAATHANGTDAPAKMKIRPLYQPNFAMSHPHYWSCAIAMLKMNTTQPCSTAPVVTTVPVSQFF